MATENDPYGVDLAGCRGRQERLLAAVVAEGCDLLVFSRRESVQWLTGVSIRAPYTPLAAIEADGRVTLVLPSRQVNQPAAADELVAYEEKWHSTLRDVQKAASAQALHAVFAKAGVGTTPNRIGCEFSSYGPHLAAGWEAVATVDIEESVFRLRRHKDPDELLMLRRANEANRAMYEVAREMVRPGVNELDVFNALYATAVKTLGEPPTYIGQDYRSGARGGAPRDRKIVAGELYIFDLGVGFRGYYSDNCRTLAVGGKPTDAQLRAWSAVKAVFPVVEAAMRPGASCRQLFETVQQQLDEFRPWVFDSHLGHGVGLAPQEGPHLNPYWDDTFAEGDFLAVEPGLYHEADLRHGVRLEQNYLVTAGGAQLLTDWPIEL